jgi:carbamoyl-phosphate synthase/aspartate carbamoyltransferase
MDNLLRDVPAHFEAAKIHIAGLVVASYSGEDFSHFLAQSSLGTWLKEQGVPAMHGVDTRALTKRIREEGSMLGRMLIGPSIISNGPSGDTNASSGDGGKWRKDFEDIDWVDPNAKNLVAEGNLVLC